MQDNQLDAIVAPGASAHGLLAIGGYPAVSVPAGYAANGPSCHRLRRVERIGAEAY